MKKTILVFSVLLAAIILTGCADRDKLNNELKITGKITVRTAGVTDWNKPVTLYTIESNGQNYYGATDAPTSALFPNVGDNVEMVLDTKDIVVWQNDTEQKPDGTVCIIQRQWLEIKSFKILSK